MNLCKLSIQQINSTISKLENENCNEILCSSIINPLMGLVFIKSGSLSNIRFFGPGIKTTTETNKRVFLKDESNFSTTSLAIALFPSENGTLSISSNLTDTFYHSFQNDLQKGVDFLGSEFAKILKSDFQHYKSTNTNDDQFVRIDKMLIDEFQKESKSIYDNKEIKLMMIHSFIISTLDNPEYIEMYLRSILNNIRLSDLESNYPKVNILEEMIAIYQNEIGFPFSLSNPPPSNINIPVYIRETGTYDLNKMYPDCADVLLLNICNCLFYDTKNFRYSLDHLNLDPQSDLAVFYSKHQTIFDITPEIRSEWSKVVEGLPDFKAHDTSEFRTDLIVYKVDHRNEIKSGIINMMNVLIKICNFNHENFWNDMTGKNMPDYIKLKITELLQLMSNKNIEIRIEDLRLFNSKDRVDFTGDVIVTFRLLDRIINIKIWHVRFHAEMTVLSDLVLNSNSQALSYVEESPHLSIRLLNLLRIQKLFSMSEDDTVDVFEKIYFTGLIETNEQKCRVLLDIFNELCSSKSSEYKVSLLNEIVSVILGSVCLDDRGTRKKFRHFLCNTNNLQIEEVIECWIETLGIDNSIYKLWSEKIIALNPTSLNLCIQSLNGERILDLFETLKRCSHLKDLEIVCDIDKKFNAAFVADGLKMLPFLESLNFSNNNLSSRRSKIIAKALKQITSLKTLVISNCCMKDDEMRTIFNSIIDLPEITSLCINNNNISLETINYISEALHKKQVKIII